LSWTPYMNGVWTLDPRLGWIWVSNEAWGWTPYHFGSWLLSPTLGWVWVPGGPAGLHQWEPACVNWVQVGNQVGWVARSPLDRDGAPANLAMGVVTRPGRSPRNANKGNEIVMGKELQTATVLKEPPKEIASQPVPGAPRFGISPVARMAPQTLSGNSPIVLDRRTHTFINRDGREAENDKRPTTPPATVSPRAETNGEIPRLTIPSTMPAQPAANRVLLPPTRPTAPPTNASSEAHAASPTRAPAAAPATPQRPPTPLPTAPPAAPRTTSGELGSVTHPTAPAQPHTVPLRGPAAQ